MGQDIECELQYSRKFKERILTKVQNSENSVVAIAAEAGIPRTTLYGWLRLAKIANMSKKKKQGRPRKARFSPKEKLRLVNEASTLSDNELGSFLRREGLHEIDLQSMREAALQGLTPAVVQRGMSPLELELKQLKKELRRKEKALAEAAALLILQKKFQALLAEEGDEMGGTFGDD